MEKIRLKFSVTPGLILSYSLVVVLTLDEKGKSYKVRYKNYAEELAKKLSQACLEESANNLPKNKKEMPPLSKRVLNAFTENTINKILSKDEIPNESGFEVLDGHHYEITITKGDVKKEYYANDASIETYPLLRYLASWYRKQ